MEVGFQQQARPKPQNMGAQMRKTIVTLLDDIDGTEADRTIQFGLDGTTYEIDLNETNAKKLETALAPFVEKATRVPGRRSTGQTRTTAGRSFSQNVRAWAKDQGITVPDRGRVPNTVVEQYKAAHQ